MPSDTRRPQKPTTGAARYGQPLFQLSTSVLGFQGAFAEIAKQHTATLNLGLGTALAESVRATPLQPYRDVLKFGDLARSTSAFAAGFSTLSSLESLSSKSVFSSAQKLFRIYENHPAFRSVASRAAVITTSVADVDLVDASARRLVEDDAASLDVAELVDALLKKVEEESGTSARSFRVGNIASGALFLGILVLLYTTASDIVGVVSPELSDLLDRQFTYASLAMATLYFLYQEGKR